MKYNSVKERTFVLVKPDGLARGLTGEILSRFERKGLTIVAARMIVADEALAAEHYAEHKGNNSYFALMKKALLGGPSLAVVLEGEMAVAAARQLIGSSNPFHSQIGTIRGDFATKMGENLIHGADSIEAAKREIGLWLSDVAYNVPESQNKQSVKPGVSVSNVGSWGPPKKNVPIKGKQKPLSNKDFMASLASFEAANISPMPSDASKWWFDVVGDTLSIGSAKVDSMGNVIIEKALPVSTIEKLK